MRVLRGADRDNRSSSWVTSHRRQPGTTGAVPRQLHESCPLCPVLMWIENRLFLGIDAASRFSGMALACSAGLSLALAESCLIPLPLSLAAVVGPQGRRYARLLALLQEPASYPQSHAVPHPREHLAGPKGFRDLHALAGGPWRVVLAYLAHVRKQCIVSYLWRRR